MDFLRFSLVSASRDYSLAVMPGLLIVVASLVAECGLSSCGTQPQLPRGMWDLPGPGMEADSPACRQILIHCTTREVPILWVLTNIQ